MLHFYSCPTAGRLRRGGRAADRTGLENRSARKGTGGSNPPLSAIRKWYVVCSTPLVGARALSSKSAFGLEDTLDDLEDKIDDLEDPIDDLESKICRLTSTIDDLAKRPKSEEHTDS